MEIKTGDSLQTKQTLSQVQMESLNVLSMSMTELREFLQNEEIENPLVEYSSGGGGRQIPVTYRETERFTAAGLWRTRTSRICIRRRTGRSRWKIW